MKKEMIVTKTFEFDYNGEHRNAVIAAVSELLPEGAFVFTEDTLEDYLQELTECPDDFVIKRVSIGFSICNSSNKINPETGEVYPGDEFDEDLGKKIAIGKARTRPFGVLYATHAGLINTRMVDALIEQEIDFCKRAPGNIVTAFNEATRRKH